MPQQVSSNSRFPHQPKLRLSERWGRVGMTLSLLVFLLWMSQAFLKPIAMGAVCAAVLFPLFRKLQHKISSSSLRALIVTIGFSVTFMLPFGVLLFIGTTRAVKKVSEFHQQMQANAAQSNTSDVISAQTILATLGLDQLVDSIQSILPVEAEQIQLALGKASELLLRFLTGVLQDLTTSLPSFFASIVVVVVTLYFLLQDGPRLIRWLRRNSFFGAEKTDALLLKLGSLCKSVVWASVLSGLVQTALMGIACLIAGVPNVSLFIVATFLLSFLPILGTAPISLYFIGTSLLNHQMSNVILFGVFAFVISISDNYVRPLVLREGSSLHPLVGFVAAFAGLDILGFYGLFIGPILAGFLLELIKVQSRSLR